jgi:hypothetical protein
VIQQEIKGAAKLQTLANDALTALDGALTPEQARLQATVAFGEFYAAELTASLERWRTHAARRSVDRRPAGG